MNNNPTSLFSMRKSHTAVLALLLVFRFCDAAVELAPLKEKGKLVPIKACVWDPFGTQGPTVQVLKRAKILATKHGIDLTYEVNTDERITLENFRIGRCDMANMLGFRARLFNEFTGSIEAIAGLRSYDQFATVVKSLSSPKAARLMRSGEYEVIGIGPAGAVHVFTNNRSLLSPDDMGGLRMAVLEGIPEAEYLSRRFGITPVNSDVNSSFLKFNNGSVDMTAGPAIVYEPFELHKGIGENGGIYKEPILYLSMQLVARWEKLPEGFGQYMREQAYAFYANMLEFIQSPERRIPDHLWIRMEGETLDRWIESFRQSRMVLGDQGIYNAKMLVLLRKVRCAHDPNEAECTADTRE